MYLYIMCAHFYSVSWFHAENCPISLRPSWSEHPLKTQHTSILSSWSTNEFFSVLSASNIVCFWIRLSVSAWSLFSNSASLDVLILLFVNWLRRHSISLSRCSIRLRNADFCLMSSSCAKCNSWNEKYSHEKKHRLVLSHLKQVFLFCKNFLHKMAKIEIKKTYDLWSRSETINYTPTPAMSVSESTDKKSNVSSS